MLSIEKMSTEKKMNRTGDVCLLSRRLPTLRATAADAAQEAWQRSAAGAPSYSFPLGAPPAGQLPKTSPGSRREQQAAGRGG